MTIEALREKLMSLLEDDADRAGIIDAVIEAETEDRKAELEKAEAEKAERTAEVERMRGEIEALNRTNEKLLSKIKYGSEIKEETEEDENVDITIADLFKEE